VLPHHRHHAIPRSTPLRRLIVACGPQKKSDSQESEKQASASEKMEPELTKVWETDTVLTTCESVLYYPEEDVLYVSNIAGKPTDQDGVGFISKLNTDGDIETLKWVEGLDAPKGMGILDNQLYVTNINELIAINLSDGSIAERYVVDGAQFLNDVAIGEGKVFFSDMNTGKIHVLENGEITTVAEGRDGVNGLAHDGNKLYALDQQGLNHFGMETPVVLNSEITGGDGLIIVNDTTYIASRWKGQIFLALGGETHLLLDTNESSQTADIGFIPEENLVLVPTFFSNKVEAYKLEY
jgi:outer membrane protein assembly factor BamB